MSRNDLDEGPEPRGPRSLMVFFCRSPSKGELELFMADELSKAAINADVVITFALGITADFVRKKKGF